MRPCTGIHCPINYTSSLIPQTCKCKSCEYRTELSDIDIAWMRAFIKVIPETAKEYVEQFDSYLIYMGTEMEESDDH